MHKLIETRIRQIELDLSTSLDKLPKPASEYTVKHLIRDKVLQVHKLGSQYACNHFNVKHFNTAQDFAEIGKIADDVYRVFTYAKNQEAALIALTSITLAHATRSKARQISQAVKDNNIENMLEVDSNNLAVVMTAVTGDPFVTTEPDQLPTIITVLQWETEGDALVCPDICEPLDGQTWEVDDPNIPTPVIDTHPNCRCRLTLVDQEQQ